MSTTPSATKQSKRPPAQGSGESGAGSAQGGTATRADDPSPDTETATTAGDTGRTAVAQPKAKAKGSRNGGTTAKAGGGASGPTSKDRTATTGSTTTGTATSGTATTAEASGKQGSSAPKDRGTSGRSESASVPTRVLGYRRQRFEARKVRRLIRHVDPWSVLKLSLLLGLCMWLIAMIASVIIWSVANNTGALDSLEEFFRNNLQIEDFRLNGDVLFRQFGLISLLGALGFAAAAVVMSLVFNLISDIIGGVWVSVIEEETARPIVEQS